MTDDDAPGEVEAADVAAGEELARYRHHPLARAAGFLSDVADQPPLTVLCGAVLAAGLLTGDPRLAGTGARMLTAFAGATLLKRLVKASVTRTRPHTLAEGRPYEAGVHGPEGDADGDRHAFPSGHTAGALAAARALGRGYPGARGPAYAGVGAIALAQLPRGAHYPLDLVAGAVAGLAAEALSEAAWSAADDAGLLPVLLGGGHRGGREGQHDPGGDDDGRHGVREGLGEGGPGG